jgi:DNA-binding YbaB/EbfC family protein
MRPGDIQKMMKIQKELQDANDYIEKTEFVGHASGVNVFVLGSRQVVDIQMQTELLEDPEILRDALIVAINDALIKIDESHKNEVDRITGGMIPGGKFSF